MPPTATTAEVVARYNSTRTPSNIYEVRRHADGVLSCSCPGWRFSGAPKTCRHTKRVVQGLDDDATTADKVARETQLAELLRDYGFIDNGSAAAVRLHLTKQREYVANPATMSGRVVRLLDALESSGLFAARTDAPRRPVGAGRSARLITLDD